MSRRRKWTKEKIITAILIRNDQGLSLCATKIIKENCKLYSATLSYFGSWKKAIEAAGLDYSQIKMTTTWETWTKEKVIQAILERKEKGLSLNASNVLKKLYSAACSYFGSWKKAIEAAGLDYSQIKLYDEWSKEKIIQCIIDRKNKGAPLSSEYIQENEPLLFKIATYYFGDWKKAIEAAGLNYSQIKLYGEWSKEKIIQCIIDRKNKGLSLSAKSVLEENNKLIKASLYYFNSWAKAIRVAGLSYSEEARFVKSKTRLELIGEKKLQEIKKNLLINVFLILRR